MLTERLSRRDFPRERWAGVYQDASNSAADQARQWGMHNDGIVYFPIDGSARGLIVENNAYTDDVLLFPDGTANWNAEKTAKSPNAHGFRSSRSRSREGEKVPASVVANGGS